jgi:ABC-type phosphate transport system substrate-binding protein
MPLRPTEDPSPMKRNSVFLSLVATIGVLSSPLAAQSKDFTIIVNASNPVASLPRDDVAKLFLKKTVTWSSGQAVAPVELPATAKARVDFARDVLNKSVGQVKSYWQQQIFSGRDVPPPEKQTENDVVAFVRSNPGAIGYVSKGVDIGRGVKPLAVQP